MPKNQLLLHQRSNFSEHRAPTCQFQLAIVSFAACILCIVHILHFLTDLGIGDL